MGHIRYSKEWISEWVLGAKGLRGRGIHTRLWGRKDIPEGWHEGWNLRLWGEESGRRWDTKLQAQNSQGQGSQVAN